MTEQDQNTAYAHESGLTDTQKCHDMADTNSSSYVDAQGDLYLSEFQAVLSACPVETRNTWIDPDAAPELENMSSGLVESTSSPNKASSVEPLAWSQNVTEFQHRAVKDKSRYTTEEDWFISQGRVNKPKIPYSQMPELLKKVNPHAPHRASGALQVHHSQGLNKRISRFEDLSEQQQAIVRRSYDAHEPQFFAGMREEADRMLNRYVSGSTLDSLIPQILDLELQNKKRTLLETRKQYLASKTESKHA